LSETPDKARWAEVYELLPEVLGWVKFRLLIPYPLFNFIEGT
jgi:hypothetical protein